MLQLEDDDEAVDDDAATPEEPLDPAERVELQKEMIALLHMLHKVGARFCCLGFLYGSL